MRGSAARRLAAVLATAALAAPVAASAQTRPAPQPPAAPGGAAPGESGSVASASAAPPQAPRDWIYSLGLGAGWESNVGLSPGAPQSDFGGVGHASLTRTFRGTKGDLSLSGRALGYVYDEQTQYNSLNGDVRLYGQRRLGVNSTGSLDLTVTSDQSYNTGILIEQGTLLPATRVTTYAGSAELRRRLSELNTLRFSALAHRVDFAEATQGVPSDRLRMSVDFDRRMSLRDNVTLVYSAEVANDSLPLAADGEAVPLWWSHYFSTQWSRRFSSRTGLLLEGGASYTPQGVDAGLESQWSFFGGASLDYRVGRSSVTAYYRREVIPIFGTGTLRLADRMALSLTAPFAGKWVLSLGGSYSGSGQPGTAIVAPDPVEEEPAPTGERQATVDSFGSLSVQVSRRVWLSANGRYLHQSAIGTFPALEDTRGALLLVLATPGSTPSLTPWR